MIFATKLHSLWSNCKPLPPGAAIAADARRRRRPRLGCAMCAPPLAGDCCNGKEWRQSAADEKCKVIRNQNSNKFCIGDPPSRSRRLLALLLLVERDLQFWCKRCTHTMRSNAVAKCLFLRSKRRTAAAAALYLHSSIVGGIGDLYPKTSALFLGYNKILNSPPILFF